MLAGDLESWQVSKDDMGYSSTLHLLVYLEGEKF